MQDYDIRGSERTLKLTYDLYKKIITTKDDIKAHIILVGNKFDLESHRQVTYEMGQYIAKKMNVPFYETSAKIPPLKSIEKIFIELLTQKKEYMKQQSYKKR